MSDSIYDLPRLLELYRVEERLTASAKPLLELLVKPAKEPRSIGVLSGSFNPLTRGHEALVAGALRARLDAVLLLLPLRAVDKEGVTRATAADRALVLCEWARRHPNAGVGMVNRGLLVEQAELVGARFPRSRIAFLVGHDKIVQVFDPRYYTDREEALRALFARATFYVAPRQGQGEGDLQALLARTENGPYAERVEPLRIDADVDALSSTAVRDAITRGEPWEELVPAEAAHFIRETQPYAPPMVLPGGEEIDVYGMRQKRLLAVVR